MATTGGNGPDVRVRLTAEGVREVIEALRQVQQAGQQAQNASSGIQSAAAAFGVLKGALAGLAGLAVLDKIKDFAEAGVNYNATMESAEYGIAAVIYGQTRLVDAQGKTLDGQAGYNAALEMSKRLMKQLQVDALTTSAALTDLVPAFQAGLSSAIGAGITDLMKVEKLILGITQAAGTMGVPSNMLKQEITSIFRADVTKDSVVGSIIAPDNKQIQGWIKAGTIVQELEKRLVAYNLSATNAAKTFTVLASNAKEAFMVMAGASTKGLFEGLKDGLDKAFEGMLTKAGDIAPTLQPTVDLVNRIGEGVGSFIGNGVAFVVEKSKEFGAWLTQNKEQVDDITYGFSEVFSAIGAVIKNAFSVLGILGDSNDTLSIFQVTWRVVLSAVAAVSDAISGMKIAVLVVGSAIMQYILGPLGRGIAALGSAADSVGAGFGKGMQGYGERLANSAEAIKKQWFADGNAIIAKGSALVKAYDSIENARTRAAKAGTGKAKEIAAPDSGAKVGGLRNPKPADDSDAKKAKKAAEQLAKAVSATQQAAAENELKILQAKNKLMEQEEKENLENGLLSLEAYFAKRKAALEKEADAEQKILSQKMSAAMLLPTGDAVQIQERLKAIDAVKTEQQLKDIKNQQAQSALETQRLKQLRSLTEDRLEMDAKVLEMQGKKGEAARVSLQIEIDKTEELLKRLGKTAEERQKVLDQMRTSGEATISFDETSGASDAAFALFEREKRAIERQVESGQLFQFQGEERILNLQRERIPVLEAIAVKMREIAIATKDAAKIQQAEELLESIQDLKLQTDVWGKSMADLKQAGFDAATSGFSTFLTDIATGAEGVGGAFKKMGASIASSMAQMLAQMLAMQAMKALFSSFGFSLPGLATGGQLTRSGVVHASTGGFVTGPGTATSDSIPAMLSDKEFVVRAAIVRQPGVLDALHRLNAGGVGALNVRGLGNVKRFADGGLVGSGGGTPAAGDNSSLTVGLAPGLLLQELKTSAGRRLIVETLGQEKNAVKKLIG